MVYDVGLAIVAQRSGPNMGYDYVNWTFRFTDLFFYGIATERTRDHFSRKGLVEFF